MHPDEALVPTPDVQPGRLARNALWLGAGEFASRVIGLGLAIYLAHVLGPEGYGLTGSALAFVSYFMILVAGGVEFHGVRDIAQHPERLAVVVGHVFGTRLILLCGSLLLMVALVIVLPNHLFGRLDLVAVQSLMLVTFAFNTTWALRAVHAMRAIAVGLVAQNLVMASATIAFVREPRPILLLVPAIQVASELGLVLWYLRHLQSLGGRMRPVFDWATLLPTLKETLHVSLGRIPRGFYFQGDILLLSWLIGAVAAGEFVASHKIIMSIVMVGLIYEMNAFPVTSRLAATNPLDALRFQRDILRYALIVMAPIVAIGAAYASVVIDLVYGAEFAGAAAIFSWMLLTVPVFEASIVLQDLLIATRRNNLFISANLAAMTIHLVAGVLLIPGRQGQGAALACLAGEAVGLVLLTIFVRRAFGHSPFSWRMLAPLVGGLAMYAVLRAGVFGPRAVAVVLAGLLYGVVGLVALTRPELARMGSLVRRTIGRAG